MIYVCVPVHNEARTAGLVLWKVRQVFTAFPREYQLLVLDDASTDDTGEVLASYAKVLPMTVVTHRERRGYAASLEELLRLALQRTDRPKRDCAITLHADFVHSPEAMDEMVKHLESGADLVVAELVEQRGSASRTLRFARRWTPRLLPLPGLKDTVSGFVAVRLMVLRQALRRDDAPLLRTNGWRARPIIRAARLTVTALLLAAGAALTGGAMLRAQSDTTRTDTARARVDVLAPIGALVVAPAAVPFPVGERLVYGARYGPFSVGTATMQVAGIDTIRGVETVHFVFLIDGGALWYHIHQDLES